MQSHNITGNLWRDVWRELRHNPSAIAGFSVVLFLIVFCVAGDGLWKNDPAAFDMTQLSQSPNLGLQTQIIYPEVNEASTLRNTATANLQLQKPATTESVQLAWPAEAPNITYRIYRHALRPTGLYDLGIPLARTTNTFYEDQLQLENRQYFYSVATLNAQGGIAHYSTLPVAVAHATPLAFLQQQHYFHAGTEKPKTFVLPAHPLGTDKLGRDMLARIISGGKTSLFIGFTAPFLYVLCGAIYGAVSGYRGGKIDTLMMAFADFIIALPFLLFMILLRIAFGIGPGSNGMAALMVALLLLSWPNTARLVRAQVLQLRNMAYVDAARLQGASGFYIVWRHLLPNVLPSIVVTLSFAIPSAIFTEAFLSFIGLGVVPPATSWGAMCNDGLSSFLIHPHELLFPAFFISITVLAFNLLGDGLRDALDVQTREGRA